MTSNLRNKPLLKGLFRVRDLMMNKLGLFSIKKKLKFRRFLKKIQREDATKKCEVALKIEELPDNLVSNIITGEDIIFSVTSYGKRVNSTLPYMLYSLLTQTVLPKKIVVNLDKDTWNDDNLPVLMKKLKKVGIEIHYCKDTRSYKKLLPTLRRYPDNPIVTVDDDIYYNSHLHEWIMSAYDASDKRTVLGLWGCMPEKKNGKYVPYNQWKDMKYGKGGEDISFIGEDSVCYPPHIFDDEIFNEEVFMKLCPAADDIWFWAMEERQGIKKAYTNPCGYGHHVEIERINVYNFARQEDNLMYENVINNRNNEQLRNLLDYYHLD